MLRKAYWKEKRGVQDYNKAHFIEPTTWPTRGTPSTATTQVLMQLRPLMATVVNLLSEWRLQFGNCGSSQNPY